MNPLSSTIQGLQIVASLSNPAGNGELKYTAPVPEVPAIYNAFDNISDTYAKGLTITIGGVQYRTGTTTTNRNAVAAEAQALLRAGPYKNATVTYASYHYLITVATSETVVVTVYNQRDSGLPWDWLAPIGGVSQTQVYADSEPANIAWKAPGQSFGVPLNIREGVSTLFSSDGIAYVRVNVTLSALPTIEPSSSETAQVYIAQSQIVAAKAWYFRRSGVIETSKALSAAVTMAGGAVHNLTIGVTTASITLPADDHPVSVSLSLVDGIAGDTQTEQLTIQFDDIADGRTSYSKLAVIVSGTQPSIYQITHNDPTEPKTARNAAIERLRAGNFSGDVRDQVLVITSNDSEADLAMTLLNAGTDYAELIEAGFSTATATLLLGAYYSVPAGEQATRTASLNKLAIIRSMESGALSDFVTWAHTNGVTLPWAEMAGVLGKPVYSVDDTALITGYVDSL